MPRLFHFPVVVKVSADDTLKTVAYKFPNHGVETGAVALGKALCRFPRRRRKNRSKMDGLGAAGAGSTLKESCMVFTLVRAV